MPRLITLLPCEKVIVDRDGMPSLISLFENLHIAPAAGEGIIEIPRETITYREWAVFCEWEVNADEVGMTADQIFEMQFPDGTVAPIKGKIPFVFEKPGTHRNHQNIIGFPVGQEGAYTIRVWLEKDGKPISEIGTRQMNVVHKIPPGAKEVKSTYGQSPA
jgi:hypothetical protein